MQIYVSGPIILYNNATLKRSLHNISIVCRRISLCRHVPVSAALVCADYFRDPRFANSLWWYKDVARALMSECELMCFIHEPVHGLSKVTEFERKEWEKLLLPEDIIVQYLTKLK